MQPLAIVSDRSASLSLFWLGDAPAILARVMVPCQPHLVLTCRPDATVPVLPITHTLSRRRRRGPRGLGTEVIGQVGGLGAGCSSGPNRFDHGHHHHRRHPHNQYGTRHLGRDRHGGTSYAIWDGQKYELDAQRKYAIRKVGKLRRPARNCRSRPPLSFTQFVKIILLVRARNIYILLLL